jgi:hypothetical protein
MYYVIDGCDDDSHVCGECEIAELRQQVATLRKTLQHCADIAQRETPSCEGRTLILRKANEGLAATAPGEAAI